MEKIEYRKISRILSAVTEELVVYVKREFHRLCYRSADFAHLPVDMSDGSRELLLAFAWLLHSEQIVYKFSMNCTTLFDDDTSSLYDVCWLQLFGRPR